MDSVAGIILIFMMFLTVSDVVLRAFGHPIIATYEMVTWAAAMVVAFAIPRTSFENGHIAIDFMIGGQSENLRTFLHLFRKVLGIILFLIIAWYLFQKGNHLRMKGDMTDILHIPTFPLAYAIGLCCFVESLVLIMQLPKTSKKGSEHE
jgi:TRAP-type C4-dicarboxylate transport system permease small subunit